MDPYSHYGSGSNQHANPTHEAYGGFNPPPRPPFGFPPGAMPPFRPYDAYASNPPRPPYPYEQPRPATASEAYDPYRPSSSAYDPGRPSLLVPDSPYPPRPLTFSSNPPPRPEPTSQPRMREQGSEQTQQDYTVLTPPVTVTVEGHTAVVHSLPPSHLPLTKYIPVNRDDALQLHRHLTSREASIWYAGGSNRAGEGWSAAVEWIYDSGRSGSKMRGCVGGGDALDAELGGIYKAVEGFHELLRQSLKNATQMPHHLIVFCDSQAAIVGIDTSTRQEAIKFDELWREICTEFIKAHLTLVWLPARNTVEGYVLADKIATVGASNAYLKKKKDGVLPDIYRRPGGGETSSPGSSHPGNWQRGETEPGKRHAPFERPIPRFISPQIRAPEPLPAISPVKREQSPHSLHKGGDPAPVPELEEEIPKEGSIFVTHFPDHASAKDIGILFSQFGSIESVDIYHVSPNHPRLAYVAFLEESAGPAAIAELHRKPVNTDTSFAEQNKADFEIWRSWNGVLTVVMAEPPLLVPSSVSSGFPNLPDWAKRGRGDTSVGKRDADVSSSNGDRKRDLSSVTRELEGASATRATDASPPRKRLRSKSNSVDPQAPQCITPAAENDNTDPGVDLGLTRIVNDIAHTSVPDVPTTPSSLPAEPMAGSNNLTPPVGSLDDSDKYHRRSSVANNSRLPPTPSTAERPHGVTPEPTTNDDLDGKSKKALTNSAAEPQEHPIKPSAQTLTGLIDLVRDVFSKHESNNWIAHSCLIAFELDQARRALQGDLFATDEAFLAGREHEQILAKRDLTPSRIDAFVTKVLGVLDGIAAAEEEPDRNADSQQNLEALQATLDRELEKYPTETKEAVASAGRLMEYLLRGKDLQEKKRLDIERRAKVLEGMVKVGEVVGGVVRFLLTEDR